MPTNKAIYVNAIQTLKAFTITYPDGIELTVNSGDYIVAFDDNDYVAVMPQSEFVMVFVPSSKGRFKRVRAPYEPQVGELYSPVELVDPEEDYDVGEHIPDPHAQGSDEVNEWITRGVIAGWTFTDFVDAVRNDLTQLMERISSGNKVTAGTEGDDIDDEDGADSGSITALEPTIVRRRRTSVAGNDKPGRNIPTKRKKRDNRNDKL